MQNLDNSTSQEAISEGARPGASKALRNQSNSGAPRALDKISNPLTSLLTFFLKRSTSA